MTELLREGARKMPAAVLLCACALCAIGAEDGDLAAKLKTVPAESDIDWENCIAWGDGRKAGTAPHDALLALLGLRTIQAEIPEWKTEPIGGVARHFRIAFSKPCSAGTLCTDYAGEPLSVSILNENAPYPGDVADNGQWTTLAPGAVKTLPVGTRIRALRFTHKYSPMPWDAGLAPSRMGRCLLLAGRFWNPAQLGTSEWSKFQEPPRKDNKARLGPVDQWIGCWPKDLKIAGIAFLRQPVKDARMAFFPAGVEDHALAPSSNKWSDLEIIWGTNCGPAALKLPHMLDSRALRLRAPSYFKRETGLFTEPHVIPLVVLNDDALAPASFLPRAPFAFTYDMPMDGFVAISIRDSQSRSVRRLVSEVERSRGSVVEAWDLKDDQGKYVPAGTYTWNGICRPPLKLTYEMTVYNAGHPPWFAPVRGGGGWMADHTPPQAICAFKEGLVIAAPGAEFGSGIIATDLDGNKIWNGPGHGAERLVSDGRFVYAVNRDSIIRIDPETGFAQTKILDFHYTPDTPGHAPDWILSDRSGVACRDGKLYISYDAPGPPWIRSSIDAGNVDLEGCFPPPYREKTHESAYGPAEKLLGTFLTIQSSQQAVFGKTVATGMLKKTLVLTLKKEASLGSVVLPPGDIHVFALRPGKTLPAWMNPKSLPIAGLYDDKKVGDDLDLGLDEIGDSRFDEATWLPLTGGSAGQPGIAVPAEGTHTRVLAFTGKKLESLDYSLVLDRRYRNAIPAARQIVLEGEKTAAGAWTTKRGPDRPISSNDPPTAGFVWEKPVPLRGFALLKPMEWAGVAVDIWTGDADAAITDESFKKSADWRQVRIYHKADNGVKFSWHTDKVILGDFGDVLQVRAVRIRIVEPPRSPGSNETTFSGGFQGMIAFQPLGKDVEIPRGFAERITVVELPQKAGDPAKVLRNIAVPHPGAMAFDKRGTLYVKTAAGIARIPAIDDPTDPQKLDILVPLEEAKLPRALAIDADSLLYVLDGDSKTIKVFDLQSGKLVRSLGKTGGGGLGPWDPAHFDQPVAMTLDVNGKLWVVEQHYQPKRISRWTRAGIFEKEFLGPTNYGGGGFMDPGDHTVVNHLGMKFRIDYAKRTWKLEGRYNWMNARNAYSPDRILRAHGHRYMIGDHSAVLPEFNDHGPTLMICEEKDGVAVPLNAAGLVSGLLAFEKSDEILKNFGGVDPDQTSFCWTDLNCDGKVQKNEVQILSGPKFRQVSCVGEDLSLNFTGWRLRPKEIRADGLPIYDIRDLEVVPELSDQAMVTPAGETFVLHNKFLDRDGKLVWTYLDSYSGVGRSNATPFGFTQRPAGVLAGSISALGHFKLGDEDLFSVNGNHGDYFVFTRDGMLAATILGGPAGYGRRFFSTPECEPGKTDLSDLRATVENFRGHVCVAEDGNVYAIAGKNHISVLRVDGLANMKRFGGTFELKARDVQETMHWSAEATRIEHILQAPKVFTVRYRTHKPKIDGEIYTDWPTTQPMEIHKGAVVQGVARESTVASLGFDAENLYVAAKALDDSPMLNSGQDWKKIFQQGDGFDLHLGLDPAADINRATPASGDIRVVISVLNGSPIAVLYRYKAQGPSLGGEAVKFTSPVGETTIDEVVMLKGCTIQIRRVEKSWILEAAIPWKALGAKAPEKSVSLRGDVGVIVSDPSGINAVSRLYWANHSTVVMSDLPAEARVIPSLWGEFRFDVLQIEDLLKDNALDDADILK